MREIETAFWLVFGESMSVKLYWFEVTNRTGRLELARIAASWNCGKLAFAESRIMDKVGASPKRERNESSYA